VGPVTMPACNIEYNLGSSLLMLSLYGSGWDQTLDLGDYLPLNHQVKLA